MTFVFLTYTIFHWVITGENAPMNRSSPASVLSVELWIEADGAQFCCLGWDWLKISDTQPDYDGTQYDFLGEFLINLLNAEFGANFQVRMFLFSINGNC